MTRANTKKRARSPAYEDELYEPAVSKRRSSPHAPSSPLASTGHLRAGSAMASMCNDAWSMVFRYCDAADLFRLAMTGDADARTRVALSTEVVHALPYNLPNPFNTLSAFPNVQVLTVDEVVDGPRAGNTFAWPEGVTLPRLVSLTHKARGTTVWGFGWNSCAQRSCVNFSPLLRNAPNLKRFHSDSAFDGVGLNRLYGRSAERETVAALSKTVEHISVPCSETFLAGYETKEAVLKAFPALRSLQLRWCSVNDDAAHTNHMSE